MQKLTTNRGMGSSIIPPSRALGGKAFYATRHRGEPNIGANAQQENLKLSF